MASSSLSHVITEHQIENFTNREFGFWIYLMTDAIIFALLFATYVTMFTNTAQGPKPETLFDLKHVLNETLCLLASSVTFGFAYLASVKQQKHQALIWLVLTIILGAGFVFLEVTEFLGMLEAGAGPQASGYLTAFFTLVATHGIHVSFGLMGIIIMVVQIAMKGLTKPVCSRLFRLGLFWHFLDIVWIGIFSVVYFPVFL